MLCDTHVEMCGLIQWAKMENNANWRPSHEKNPTKMLILAFEANLWPSKSALFSDSSPLDVLSARLSAQLTV